ncbi:MAG: hypothetical protein KJ600_04545 [Nanoarchaeota archaeon]|nr:hypothetical protein [Nanoarchaeota archaeon]MBU1103797.1 hypothetical protein [Nanoarchaeota archaeon]
MDKLNASLIVEILGRPPDHLKESLNLLVEKMGSEKGVKIINKTCHEPKEVEGSKDFFTTFAEIDVELESLSNYFGILLAYMPSHIEITYPEKLTITNADLNEVANALTQRLHNYDAVVKKALADRDVLVKKLQEVAPHLFKQKDATVQQPAEKSKPVKKSKKTKKKSK